MTSSIDIFQAELHNIAQTWKLTPLGKRDASGKVDPKAPYTPKWQTADITRAEIEGVIASGRATGFGLILGTASNGVMALDIDGTAPRALLIEIMGNEELPVTVEFTSGKPDRSQMLFQVPPQYWDALKSKKKRIPNGDTTEDLDFRWNGNQSALPPSAHPETDGYHWVDGRSPNEVEIAELPIKLIEFWLNLIEPPRAPTTAKVTSDGNTPVFIPIERLLTKAHREALGGVVDGGRDNTGIELACDLIGVEALGMIECDYKGKIYTLSIEQNARDLFSAYCSGCTPPLSESDEDRIWNSAQRRDGEPSIRDEASLKNCVRSFLKEKNISSDFYQQISKTPETGSSKGVEGADKNQHLSALSALSAHELRGRVESILSRCLTGADREAALVSLASELRIHKQSLEDIYRELERARDASADNVDIEKILSAQRQQLSPHVVFPNLIATKIEQITNARGTNPEPLILGMLIAASSVPHAITRLNVTNHGDVLSVYPNLFGMNVGDSGSLKSPTNATAFTKPLRALQKTYIDKYEIELQTYESELQEWEKQDKKERGEAPKQPRLVVVVAEDATMEKIEDLALHQPTICPGIYRDEIIGIFQAFDKHGGKGSHDSNSKLLTYYDGSPINIHRVGTGSKISKHHYHPVVFGGIQPEVLKDFARSIGMDNDGTLCRFLYAPVNRQFKEWDEDPDTQKIDTDVFSNLIEKIHRLPAIACWLDTDSQRAWAKVTNHYNRECLNNPNLSAWLKHAYSKAIGQLGKIALTMHLIECAESNSVSGIISKLTIERSAIALDYFISQSVSLIASTEDTLEAHLVRILDKAKKLETISPRVVQSLFSGKKRIDSTTARNYLDTLVDSGYGSIDDKGIFTPKPTEPIASASADNADKVLIAYQQLQGIPVNDLSRCADNADKNSDRFKNGINQDKCTSDEDLELWTKTGTNSSPPPENTVNGHHSDSDSKTGTKPSPAINNIPSNGSSDTRTKWTRNPNKNIFKIGDRAKSIDDIFFINHVTDEFVGGYTDDGSYVGGHPSSIEPIDIDVDESPPIANGYTKKETGDGFIEIVSNHSAAQTTIPEVTEDEGY